MSDPRESLRRLFKAPINLEVIYETQALPTRDELLSLSAEIRICKYAVCFTDSPQYMSPEDKDYTVKFFGGMPDLLETNSVQPLEFEEVMGMILGQANVDVPRQSVNVWLTPDLSIRAELIASDQDFINAFAAFIKIFREDPLNNSILYFFFDGPSDSSRGTRQQASPPFLEDQDIDYTAAGGVSPGHTPTTPTGSVPRRDTAMPTPARPKRTKTLEVSKKAINKLVVAVKNVPGTVKELVSPREAPEEPTVLTQLASRIEQRDYLTGLLPKTSGDLAHQADVDAYQVQQFERFSRFFPHIDPQQRGNTRSIRFRNTTLAVSPAQFVRAMEILFQHHTSGIAGGILASEMGSGKSFVILCCAVVRALLFESRRQVLKEWLEVEARDKTLREGKNVRPIKLEHLPRDAQGRRLKCPSQHLRPLDVVCFCDPNSATRNEISRLKRGATLIQVPSAAMPAWLETLEEAKFSRMAYNFTVLYSGTNLSSRLQPSPDFLKGKGSLKRGMGATLPARTNLAPGDLVTARDLLWFPESALVSEMALETHVVVTPHNSTQLFDLYSWHIEDLSFAPEVRFPPEGLYAFPFGIQFIDEAHRMERESIPMQMAAVHRQVISDPSTTVGGDLWLVSGTPFGGKLEDLTRAVSDLVPDRAADARALVSAYNAIEPAMTNTPRAKFEELFNSVFGGQLTIRDTWDTTFMGSRITDIQRVRPQYVAKTTPQSQVHAVRMLIDTKVTRGPHGTYFDTLQTLKQNTQLLYLLSLFPGAAKVLLDSPQIPFTDLDIRRLIRKETNTTGEALTANKTLRSLADKVSANPRSPKVQAILEELERISKDRTPRPQLSKASASASVQHDQTLKKMVIITPTVCTAVILYMVLARYHSRAAGPLLYHEDLKQSQRSDVLRRFNSLRKDDGPWRCLIAPASVASEALNLQVANTLILTSPLLSTHQESQALARINRMGQKLDVTLKILLLEDSPIDRILIAHRANAKIVSDPFNVEEEFKAVPLTLEDSDSTLS